MLRVDHAMVSDIKAQVMAELDQSSPYPPRSPGKQYQSYQQLVDAVREEVLYEIKARDTREYHNWVDQNMVNEIKQSVLRELESEAQKGGGRGTRTMYSGSYAKALTPYEMDMLKKDIIRDLQMGNEEQEGHSQEGRH